MKSISRWQVVLGLCLIALSVAVYMAHYFIFRDLHHILIYLIGDIAFVFFEVLMVTLVLHQLLYYREKQALMKKLNMVIGAFFSEAGTELLKSFSGFDTQASGIAKKLVVTDQCSRREFSDIRDYLKKHSYAVEHTEGHLEELRAFLLGKRNFLLTLLENPSLLEHETFTDLLWAVFHLTEELACRKGLEHLPETDFKHLEGDIKRAYRLLASEWLSYMEHLQVYYPYLFSLAMRTNPFDSEACVEVK